MDKLFRNVERWTLELRRPLPAADVSFSGHIDWPSKISASVFRQLYGDVGKPWNWFDRLMMPLDELEKLLDQPNRQVGLLTHLTDETVGFTEVCFHSPSNVELCYFGLLPAYTGRGFGTEFFKQLVNKVIGVSDPDAKIWLTTCEWDSPAAMPFYESMGFEVVRTDTHQQQVPNDF